VKTILIMRHGEANNMPPGKRDFDRTLARRGREDAARMGRHINAQQVSPTVVLSSSAERARETADAVTQAFVPAPEMLYSDDLYVAIPHTWLDEMAGLDSTCEYVLLVGHNPTMESLAALLTGEGAGMSTATVARVEVEIEEWRELAGGARGRLVDVWRPKNVPDRD
jgi:phosphohistidine phosphatase